MLRRRLDIEHRYVQGRCSLDYRTGDGDSIARTIRRRHIPLLSWSPPVANGGRILRGDADACIRKLGRKIAAQPYRILLRPFWEFNGDWYPWSRDIDGSMLSTNDFQALWRRTVDILRAQGAFSRASIVWCPHEGYYNRPVWIDARAAYPGDSYVDWVCSDDYNFALTEGWQEFGTLFSRAQAVERDFRDRKPHMVGETGSIEDPGGDPDRKGDWFRHARDFLTTSMPGTLALVYFDVNYTDGDWRIATSPSALRGFRELASDPYFSTGVQAPGGRDSLTTSPKGIE